MSIIEDLEASIAASRSALQKAKESESEAKRAAVFAEFAALGWQPRETAPRDGAMFIGWKYRCNGSANCISFMWRSERGWHATDNMDSSYGGYCSLNETCFDLWRPLPGMPYTLRGKA